MLTVTQSRRRFIHLLVLGSGAGILAACTASLPAAAPATSAPTPPTPAPIAPTSAAAQTNPPTAAPAQKPTAAAASPAQTAPTPLSPPVDVNIPIQVGATVFAPLYVSQAKGYFKDEGLTLQTQGATAGDASQQTILLAAGQIDFITAAPNVSLFNATAKGIPIKILMPLSVVDNKDRSAGLVVRQDHIDSGRYKSPEDFKGMTFALNGPSSTSQFYVEYILNKAGLTAADVKYTYIGFADMGAAFAGKTVDAAYVLEPFVSFQETQSLAKLVVPQGDMIPGALTSELLVSPVFAQRQPEATKRVAAAVLRGTRDYYRAIQLNQGGRDEIIQILVKSTSLTDPKVYERVGLPPVEPNGTFDASVLDLYQDFFTRSGVQDQRIDTTTLVDRAPLQYALDRLGRFQA
jgi:NitT/TauT family transport system substrate-binding protein